MVEQSKEITRLQKSLDPYIRSRKEALHIRQVLSLHLREAHHAETEKDNAASLPLALQELNDHLKSSTSRGLRRDYLKSLRVNSKAREEYARIASEHLDQTSTDKPNAKGSNENPLDGYITLLEQQQRLERLQVLARHLDGLDQKPPAQQVFLDPTALVKELEPLPAVPSAVLYGEGVTDKGSSAKSVNELIHQLEKAVLQAKSLLDSEKRQTSEFKSRMSQRDRVTLRSSGKQRLEALGRTRNEMISWMEEQLGKAGEDPPEESKETSVSKSKTPTESQLIQIQKEYRKYVIARQELLTALGRQAEDQRPFSSKEEVENLQIVHDTPIIGRQSSILLPYLTELMSISIDQKAQLLQRSHLNTCLAKQQKESMLSMNRLAEESHLLPAYPTKALQSRRLAERPDSLSGMLAVGERPDFITMARGWVFAADAAGRATRDAVLDRVQEGRGFVDESLHTLLGLHQLLGYDMEEADKGDEDDIWAPDSKSPHKGKDDRKEGMEQSRRDIWSTLNGDLGVIRKEN